MNDLTEKRSPRDYVNEKGDYDVVTERHYTAKPLSLTKKILSLSFSKKYFIQEFYVSNGNIKIIMQTGRSLESPLSELEFVIKEDYSGSGTTFYEIKNEETKLSFTFNYWCFDESEIQDIYNVLIRAGKITESKLYKSLKWVFMISGFVKDIFSAGSLTDIVGEKLSTDGKIEVFGNSPFANTKKESGKNGKSKWIKIILGLIIAIFLALFIIGLIYDEEDEKPVIENFNPDKKAYLLGETDYMLMLIALDMNENLTLKSNTAYSFLAIPTPHWLNDLYMALNVSEENPGEYLFSGYTPSEDWGIKSMLIKYEIDKENGNKIIFNGKIEDCNGAIENATFALLQPSESQYYYMGNIGDYPAFLSLEFGDDNDILNGMLYYENEWTELSGYSNGFDEDKDPIYTISNSLGEMEIITWSNGGDHGISGFINVNGDKHIIHLEDISNYYLF